MLGIWRDFACHRLVIVRHFFHCESPIYGLSQRQGAFRRPYNIA